MRKENVISYLINGKTFNEKAIVKSKKSDLFWSLFSIKKIPVPRSIGIFIAMEFDNMDICGDAPWHVPTGGNKKDVEILFLRLTLIYLLSKIYFFINLTLET